jgi:hypothetical protein
MGSTFRAIGQSPTRNALVSEIRRDCKELWAAGVLRIAFGTYLEAFMMSGMLLLVAAIMVLFIGAGRRSREPEAIATAAL